MFDYLEKDGRVKLFCPLNVNLFSSCLQLFIKPRVGSIFKIEIRVREIVNSELIKR